MKTAVVLLMMLGVGYAVKCSHVWCTPPRVDAGEIRETMMDERARPAVSRVEGLRKTNFFSVCIVSIEVLLILGIIVYGHRTGLR